VNDLSTFESLRNAIYPGDVLFFDGSDDNDLVQIIDNFVSNGIEVWTHSDWSHVAMILPIGLEIGGKVQTELNLIESTIENGVSGPQVNSVRQKLLHYDGTSVWCFPLKHEVREQLDWDAMWSCLVGKVGKDKYSIRTIAHFLLRPFLGWAIPHLSKSHPDEEVCSEYLAMGLVAGGIERISGKPLVPNKTSPKALAKYPIFVQPPFRILEVAH
jgi:hypothetical protein